MVESWWAVGDEAADALALIDGTATDRRMAGHADAEPNQGHPNNPRGRVAQGCPRTPAVALPNDAGRHSVAGSDAAACEERHLWCGPSPRVELDLVHQNDAERCSCVVKGRARSGQDRDRPLVVEGRLLVGHGPREGLWGGGRQVVR